MVPQDAGGPTDLPQVQAAQLAHRQRPRHPSAQILNLLPRQPFFLRQLLQTPGRTFGRGSIL